MSITCLDFFFILEMGWGQAILDVKGNRMTVYV